jgi:ABC-type nitrate/sulfonate/bicarbonate transport system ATPase subunit
VAEALDRSRNKNIATPPIMIVVGSAGYGKTELLEHLAQTHRGSSPTVRLDFAGNPDVTPTQVMLAIGRPLGEHVPGVGSVRFPLLMTGISAITLREDGPDLLPTS